MTGTFPLLATSRNPVKFNSTFVLLPAMFMFQPQAMADSYPVKQPLRISIVLHEQTGSSPNCPGGIQGTFTATGSDPQLGPLVMIGSHCIEPVQASFSFSRGKAFVTTKNGDQLEAAYSGSLVPTGDGKNFVFSSSSFQITGGTGCFKHASGGGDMLGKENIQTGQGTAQFNGSLSYKKRNCSA